MTVVGNLGMVALILMDSRLHSPMDFFLSILSFLNICYSSVVTPKLLLDFLAPSPWRRCLSGQVSPTAREDRAGPRRGAVRMVVRASLVAQMVKCLPTMRALRRCGSVNVSLGPQALGHAGVG